MLAVGFTRMADLASKPDEIQMRRVVFFRLDHRLQESMGFFNIQILRAHSEPARDAIDMGIDRECRAV